MVDTVNRITKHVQISGHEGEVNPVKNGSKTPYKTYSVVHEHKRRLRRKGRFLTYIAIIGDQKRAHNRSYMVCRARSISEARAKFQSELGGFKWANVDIRTYRKEDILLLCDFKKHEVCAVGTY